MQICIFLADSKSKAQELFNDVSFVIFGHKTWDLEGGANPPPSISWFSSTPAEIGLILEDMILAFNFKTPKRKILIFMHKFTMVYSFKAVSYDKKRQISN